MYIMSCHAIIMSVGGLQAVQHVFGGSLLFKLYADVFSCRVHDVI